MNLLNVANHLVLLTDREFGSERKSALTVDEVAASEKLFEVLKTFKDSYLHEFSSYETLEFDDECDEMTDEGESDNETDDWDGNDNQSVRNQFTLEEMEMIVDWVDQRPHCTLSTVQHRFRKVKSMQYIKRFTDYIEKHGTRRDKLNKIKEFMLNEFYLKRAVEKEAVHDTDLQLFAIQKANDLGWDVFSASESFITRFKKENRISSRRYNKLVTRATTNKKTCSLEGTEVSYRYSTGFYR